MRTARLVDDWTASGLLTPEQREIVKPHLAVDLRRTNKFLRITLFVFGGIIVQSAFGLIALAVGLSDERAAAAFCLVSGAAAFGLASWLVRQYNLYRFGVEEVVALSAAALVAIGAALLVSDSGDWPLPVGLGVGAVMLSALYFHFGYVYAAVLAVVALAALPFQFGPALGAGGTELVQRAAAVGLLAAVAVAARWARRDPGDEHPGDSLTVIEAAAWLGIYLLVNLVASGPISRVDRTSAPYWISYAAIWVLPVAGLWLALRGRERPLRLVAMAAVLATVLSNKAYLGSPRHEWDPIVLGVMLMAVAIVVRRWLASGPQGMLHGYTASRLLESDKAALGRLAMVSTLQTGPPVASSAPAPPVGGGGRSGGGGAGGSF